MAASLPAFSAWKLPPPLEEPPLLDTDFLRKRTSWIRNELDPLISREGPDVLRPDNVVILFKFFEQLRTSQLMLDSIRQSRIHHALLEIAGCATRWPAALIDKAEEIIIHWELRWGPLTNIKISLYGPGGRLHSISTPDDLGRDGLLVKWMHKPNSRVIPSYSRRHGDLGFKPGDWWINAMFAYHDGVIDSENSIGGVTACSLEAYALLLTRDMEIDSPDPEHFTYRSKTGDVGRYRLTAGTIASRQPIRVLRSHTLRSFWAPRAGVRYDGLYKVTGWSVAQDPLSHTIAYNISFTRLPSESSICNVLNHPTADELDDYREYKRIRKETRTHRNPLRHGKPLTPSAQPTDTLSNESAKAKKQRKHSSAPLELPPLPPSSHSPASEVNPFFSGELDNQGTDKYTMLRPAPINFAPVVEAASAAGANIDPFFAGALDAQAAKSKGGFHLNLNLASLASDTTASLYPFLRDDEKAKGRSGHLDDVAIVSSSSPPNANTAVSDIRKVKSQGELFSDVEMTASRIERNNSIVKFSSLDDLGSMQVDSVNRRASLARLPVSRA